MTRLVLEVGNCEADHFAIRSTLARRFDIVLQRAHGPEDTLEALRQQRFDLVLINRITDRDGSDGLQVIRAIREDSQLSDTPLMLISNFADAQDLAVAAGAVRGFGKAHLTSHEIYERLNPFLAGPAAT